MQNHGINDNLKLLMKLFVILAGGTVPYRPLEVMFTFYGSKYKVTVW